MAQKTPNYTTEQEVLMLEAYSASPTQETVDALAEKLQRSTKSIVAKLSRMGIYKPKVKYLTKTGEKPEKKDVTAEAIGAILRLSENDIDSLTKATKSALRAIFKALANSKPI